MCVRVHTHVFLCKSACVCLIAQSCLTLYDPMDCSLQGSSVHGYSPGKNTGMGCHALLQGIFPTQRWNPGLTLQADSLLSEPPGKPKNSRVDSLSLLQGSFLTQVSNWGVLHYREILYQLSYQGRPAGSSVHDRSPFSYWFCTFLNINFVHGFVLLSTSCQQLPV